MEKYSQFRDRATGIAPFWPVTQSSSLFTTSTSDNVSPIITALDFIAKHIILVLRLIVLTPLVLSSLTLSSILGVTNGLEQLLNKLILVVLGVYSLDYSVENVKTRNITNLDYPSRSQLFFVNFSNPLDLFILSTIVNDQFVCLVPSLTTKGKFKQVTVCQFTKLALSGVDPSLQGTDFSIKDVKDKVILIFAEGTTSNGKSVLKFPFNQQQFTDFYNDLSSHGVKITKINSLGIKVTPASLTTPLKASRLAYAYRLLTNTSSLGYKVRLNLANELNPLELSLIKIRNSFTNSGKFKIVELGHEEKALFIQKYK